MPITRFWNKAYGLLGKVRFEMDICAFHKVLDHIWEVIGDGNRYVDEQAPWALKKTDPQRMATVLYVLGRNHPCARPSGPAPFMPESMGKMLDQRWPSRPRPAVSLTSMPRTRLSRAHRCPRPQASSPALWRSRRLKSRCLLIVTAIWSSANSPTILMVSSRAVQRAWGVFSPSDNPLCLR